MRRAVGAIIGLLLSLGVTAEVREFPLGNSGVIAIPVDDSWKATPPPADSAAAISIESRKPGQLQILLTPLPVRRDDAEVRQLVQETSEKIAPQSVEKTLTLRPLQGARVKGYYFRATDPAPNPGEYRFMYQGAASVDGMLVTFTVLFNDGAENEASSAMTAIRGMALRRR